MTRPPMMLRLPHEPRSVRVARRQLRADLEGAGLPDSVIDDAEIVLSELLGNAIRHAMPQSDGTLTVSWRLLHKVLDLRVQDGGSPMTVTQRAAPVLAVGGRGLHIVAATARAWGVVDRRGGRTVWASLRLSR